jgi:hypothetical protein
MKHYIIILFLFYTICSAQELAYIEAFGSKVYFEPPDTSKWGLEQNSMTEYGNYLLMFKHIPIVDSLGREIQPVISFIAESVKDSSDVIMYSIYKRTQTPVTVKKVLTYEDGHFTHRNVVGYEAVYKKEDVGHKVLMIHMRQASIGLQVICDATDEVYAQVESDMRRFIKSIGIDQ